jgi:predicted DsbA family dithiol-disulfide isomerase
VEARCWSDYLCPWCYVGQARDAVFEAAGVPVVHLPYELHPEIGAEGRRIRSDGRLAATFDRIEAECEAAGLPFRRPDRFPNTRRALATAEVVRAEDPVAATRLHVLLFDAMWAKGEALDDPEVLDRLLVEAGAPLDEVRRCVAAGDGDRRVAESMAEARSLGIASTPSWVIGDLVLPGALEPATLRRWVDRLVARAGTADD